MTFTKEQLIEDLKASSQNATGMFEISEGTICSLMSMLTAPQPLTTSERSEFENYRNAQQVLLKDHQIRELVNELRDIAVEYHGTQQLRERIARTIRAAMLQAVPLTNEGETILHNYRTAMEGIGHIRRTLEETFGGLHGTHVEPDVLIECKTICDAIYAAYGRAPVAVTDDELNAVQLHRLKVDGHSQLSDSFRAGFRYARRATPQPASVVPDALMHMRSIVSDPRALPRRKEWISGQQYSYVLLENVEAMVDEACRAAMLHGAEPVTTAYKLPKPIKDHRLNSGPDADDYYAGYQAGWNDSIGEAVICNSPVIPDGCCIMPMKLTAESGAKGALSGEFHVTHHIVCQSCGGEGCEDCNEEGGWDGEILIGWDIIKRIHEAAVKACSLSAEPQQEV